MYKRPDSRTGKMIFSMYSSESPIKVWDRDDWFSDIWDATEYGRDYDWNKPFLVQLRELMLQVPWSSRAVLYNVNSDYCINANHLKDCYLVFGAAYSEHSYYSYQLSHVQDSYDSAYLTDCQVSYEGFFNQKCFRVFFSSFCENSHDLMFCRDCVGCSDCFGSVGLRNKSYYFFNKPLSKEEYQKEVQKINLGSYTQFETIKSRVNEIWSSYPVKFMQGRHNTEVSGEYVNYSKNVKQSYHIDNGENLKYCQSLYINSSKDSYDYFRFGDNSELIYESSICGLNISRLTFCYDCWPECSNLTYCLSCHSSSNCFGCVGLRSKQYCIFNKQYSKEEYEKLVPQIIQHISKMPYVDRKGRVYKYGEFFPPEFSPLAYNETIAQEYFPLTKEQGLAQGYSWREPDTKSYAITKQFGDLPDQIKDVQEIILDEVISCAHRGQCNEQCTTAFKIIPQELQFYRQMNFPLPRLCPSCRHYQRLKQRNSFKLWHRRCMCLSAEVSTKADDYKNTVKHFHGNQPCPNEFETSYAPDRKEIVYCESCYNSEVV